jgi:hypothetical protein
VLIVYVDADACPVKEEVYRVATRYQMRVAVVANAPLRVPVPYVMIVHGLFTSCLDSGEVEKCILPSDGLFAEYSQLSGVYHM